METEVTKTETTEKTPSMVPSAMKKPRFTLSKQQQNRVVIALFVILILGLLYHFKGVFVAATVDGEPLSRLAIVRELEKGAGKNALDNMITKKLIEKEVAAKGIVAKKEDIEAEIKKVEEQIKSQGGTLETALTQQGMTQKDFLEQIEIRNKLEQLLADKVVVTDEEVAEYLKQTTGSTTAAPSEEMKNQVREQLKAQKFGQEVSLWVADLKSKANIKYFVDYAK